MSLCSVSVESLTALTSCLHITDAGRQPEEMGIARDEQPQLQFQIDRMNDFFPLVIVGKDAPCFQAPSHGVQAKHP